MKISENMLRFFRAEMKNEQHGGDSPATLQSAKDSMRRMPDDLIAEYCSASEVDEMIVEIITLCDRFGGDKLLESLLEGDFSPQHRQKVIVQLYDGRVSLVEQAPGVTVEVRDYNATEDWEGDIRTDDDGDLYEVVIFPAK